MAPSPSLILPVPRSFVPDASSMQGLADEHNCGYRCGSGILSPCLTASRGLSRQWTSSMHGHKANAPRSPLLEPPWQAPSSSSPDADRVALSRTPPASHDATRALFGIPAISIEASDDGPMTIVRPLRSPLWSRETDPGHARQNPGEHRQPDIGIGGPSQWPAHRCHRPAGPAGGHHPVEGPGAGSKVSSSSWPCSCVSCPPPTGTDDGNRRCNDGGRSRWK